MGFQYKRIGSAPTDAHDGGVFDKFSNYQLEKQGQIYNHVAVSYTHLTLPTKRIV